jgi:hypothetical protein
MRYRVARHVSIAVFLAWDSGTVQYASTDFTITSTSAVENDKDPQSLREVDLLMIISCETEKKKKPKKKKEDLLSWWHHRKSPRRSECQVFPIHSFCKYTLNSIVSALFLYIFYFSFS